MELLEFEKQIGGKRTKVNSFSLRFSVFIWLKVVLMEIIVCIVPQCQNWCFLFKTNNKNFGKIDRTYAIFSSLFFSSFFTLNRAKPIDCGTELNVMNYMRSVNRKSSTNHCDQLIVDNCKTNVNNQTNTEN